MFQVVEVHHAPLFLLFGEPVAELAHQSKQNGNQPFDGSHILPALGFGAAQGAGELLHPFTGLIPQSLHAFLPLLVLIFPQHPQPPERSGLIQQPGASVPGAAGERGGRRLQRFGIPLQHAAVSLLPLRLLRRDPPRLAQQGGGVAQGIRGTIQDDAAPGGVRKGGVRFESRFLLRQPLPRKWMGLNEAVNPPHGLHKPLVVSAGAKQGRQLQKNRFLLPVMLLQHLL